MFLGKKKEEGHRVGTGEEEEEEVEEEKEKNGGKESGQLICKNAESIVFNRNLSLSLARLLDIVFKKI